MTPCFSYKEEHLIVAGLQFQRFSPLYHDEKHGSMQAGMVLEKELRVLHLDLQAAGDSEPNWAYLSLRDLKAQPHNDTLPQTRPHLLQQATSPNSATPCGPVGLILFNYHRVPFYLLCGFIINNNFILWLLWHLYVLCRIKCKNLLIVCFYLSLSGLVLLHIFLCCLWWLNTVYRLFYVTQYTKLLLLFFKWSIIMPFFLFFCFFEKGF